MDSINKLVTSFKLEGVCCIKWFQSEIVVLPSLSRGKISWKEPVLGYVQTDALFGLKLQHDQKNGMYYIPNLTIHFYLIVLCKGKSIMGGSWPKSPNKMQEHPPNKWCPWWGKICLSLLSTCPKIFLPTMEISSIIKYLICDKDCCISISFLPSSCL